MDYRRTVQRRKGLNAVTGGKPEVEVQMQSQEEMGAKRTEIDRAHERGKERRGSSAHCKIIEGTQAQPRDRERTKS
jgi:hypothetical protein